MAAVGDGQRRRVIAPAVADRAAHFHRRQQVHRHRQHPRAFAALAAAAGHIERKAPRREAALLRLRLGGEQLADGREDLGVGGGVGARPAADGFLADGDQLADGLPALDGVVLAGGVGRAIEARPPGPVEDVEHQRRLARAADAGDGHQPAQRQAHGDVAQVVGARADDGQRPFGRRPARRRGNGRSPRQVRAGEGGRVRRHLGRRAHGDDPAAVLARPRPHVDDRVGGADHVQVVLDDEDGVAQVAQAAQDAQQPLGVARVQADGRFVENVEHPRQPGADQRRQPQPLRLAGRERRRGPRHRQIADADLQQAAQASVQVFQQRRGDAVLVGRERRQQVAQPRRQRRQRHRGHGHDRLPGDGDGAALRPQALPVAIGADALHDLAGHPGGVVFVTGVLAIAAQRRRGQALEATAADGGRRLSIREVAAEPGTVHAEVEQVARGRAVVADGRVQGEGQAIVPGGGQQRVAVVGQLRPRPAGHRAAGEAAFGVGQPGQVGGVDDAQTGAGGAGPLRLVEGEGGHAQLRHGPAAMGAREGRRGVGVGREAGIVVPLVAGQTEGGRHVATAVGAWPSPQPGEEDAHVGVGVGGRAHSRARAVVSRGLLVEADRRRQAGDALQRRPGQAENEHVDRLQILPRPLQVEDVEGQRRFAGAGQTGQDDKLVLGDVYVKALQVMETRATNGDDRWHRSVPPGDRLTAGDGATPRAGRPRRRNGRF